MGIFSRFEGKVEDTVEGAANNLSQAPISPVQISRRCERQMIRNKMVGAGKQYAPTLYTVLVNPDDDAKLYTFYPTLAGEIETYLRAKAGSAGLYMDGNPLVRFIVDDKLKHGKFDVIAEAVASSIVSQLRIEEAQHYAAMRNEAAASAQNVAGAYANYANAAPSAGVNANANVAVNANAMPNENINYNQAPQDEYSQDASINDPYAPSMPPNQVNQAAGQMAAGAVVAQAPYQDEYQTQLMGSANATSNANAHNANPRLVSHDGTQAFNLTGAKLIAGRSNDCNITINDINASRKHAEFSRDISGRWIIRDLGSKNGTLVNGEFVQQPTILYEGDEIVFGLTKFTFTQR